MNAILQPIHLILYIALISSAIDLVKDNMIYALVAIGFLIPAEKFVKKMFGFEAETAGGLGTFAGGALAMSGIKQAANLLKGGDKKKSQGGSSSGDGTSDNNKIRTQDRAFLGSFNGDGENAEGSTNESENNNDVRMQQETGYQQNENTNNGQGNNSNSNIVLPQSAIQDRQQQEARELRERQEQEERERQERENREQQSLNRGPQRQDGWRTKRFIRGAKKFKDGAHKFSKVAAKGVGIGAGATIGLAAGISTGDFSKAMASVGAGALAGGTIGKAAGNIPENLGNFSTRTVDMAQDKIENYRYNRDKDMYGAAYATQQAAARVNEREKTKFMKNKTQQAKYEEMAGRIAKETGNNNIKAEDLMEASFDYQKAGITDDKQIETGLTMEAKHGGINGNKHEKMIDIVNMTKDYGKDYVIDEKKRNSMQEMIKTSVSGERNQNEVWNLYTETLGMKDMGRKHAINPPRQGRPPRQRR